jgi:cobalt/nickel transport system permease protein
MRRFGASGPSVLDRTVAEISARFREFLLTGRIASRDGFLQKVNPVVKLVGVFALVVTTVATRDPIVLFGLLLLSLGLARLSKIPLRLHVSRWSFVVVISLVVVLPQLFLMSGEPLVGGTFGLTISSAGAAYVLRFTLRVATAVSLLSLVILTTPFDAVLGTLRRLPIPETMLSIMAITYRYLLLFFAELNTMVLAQRSRTFAQPSIRESWRRLGNLLGTFFIRTIERGERVQLAARSRGGGRTRQPYEHSNGLTKRDAAFAFGVAVVIAVWVVVTWLQ